MTLAPLEVEGKVAWVFESPHGKPHPNYLTVLICGQEINLNPVNKFKFKPLKFRHLSVKASNISLTETLMCIAHGKPGWGGVYTEYVRVKCEYVGRGPY